MMLRLIDADELMERLLKKKPGVANNRYTDGYNDAIMRFRSMIHGSPTVDAVPVVRCDECVHHVDCGYHYCNKWRKRCPDDSDFFCKYGERKGGGK